MDRIKYTTILELIKGINFYEANSVEDILENYKFVKSGRNGLYITLNGSYRLDSTPKICGEGFITVKSKTDEITFKEEGYIYDHSFGNLKQFPYDKEGLNVQIHQIILDEIFKERNGCEKKQIYSPAFYYEKSNNDLFYLIDFKDNLDIKKKKKLKLEFKLNDFFTNNVPVRF